MVKQAAVNIDTMEFWGEPGPIHTKPVTLFGEEWTLVCDYNAFALTHMSSGDAGSFIALLKSMILPEQWERFAQVMSTQKGLSVERMVGIVNALIEVAGERPTTPSSGSTRTAPGRTSKQR